MRVFLIGLKQAQPRPDRSGDREREHGVRNQDAGKEKKSDGSRKNNSREHACLFTKRPSAKAISNKAQQHHGQRQGQARGPVVHAKNFIGDRHHPVDQRRFFQVGNAIQAGGDPVAGDKHVAGDLRLHGVHIVHEARRAGDTNKEDEASCGYNDPTWSSTVGTVSLGAGSMLPSATFHCFIHNNNTIRPHK